MKNSFKTVLVATLAVASMALVAPAANASPAPTSQVETAAPVQLTAPDSGPLRVVDAVGKLPAGGTSYVVGSGSIVTVVPRTQSGGVTPMFSVGVGWGVYLYLNRVDQGAVAAGTAAGLAVLICAIPAVNVFGCAAVTAALATAAFYIAVYGFCSSRMEIRIPNGTAKCVN